MSNWQAITTFAFFISFFIYNLIIGKALLTVLHTRSNKPLCFVTGLMIVFAITEVVSLPFMLTRGQYRSLFITLCSVLLFILFLSASYLFLVKKDFTVFKVDYSDLANPYFYLTSGIVTILTVIPVCFAHFDGDDTFYVTISTSIQATGRIFANNPSIGLSIYPFPANYQFTSFEILLTVISTILHLEPVVINHTILPLIVIPSAFIAYLALAKALFTDRASLNEQYIFVFIMALLTLFSSYSGYLPSVFLILRSWMGKTLLITICFPTFTCYFIYAIREEAKISNMTRLISPNSAYFFLITISLLAASCLAAVGLYLLPVYYFILFLTALASLSRKYTFKPTFNMMVKAFLSVIPTIILMISYYIFMQHSDFLGLLHDFKSYKDWWVQGGLILSGNVAIIALYALSYFYFLFFGKGMNRIIFVTAPIVLLLTFLNPLFFNFVGTYLTSRPVYWRLFWLIPIFWTISAFIVESLKMLKGLKIRWLVLIPILAICNPYNLILNNENFLSPENAGKIPDYVIEDANFILNKVNTDDPNKLYLLALPKYNIYLRQYTGKIALVMPRVNYVMEAFEIIGKEDEYIKVKDLFTYDKDSIIIGYPKSFKMNDIKDLGITLIITPNIRDELNSDFTRFSLSKGDYLYIRNDIVKKEDEKKPADDKLSADHIVTT